MKGSKSSFWNVNTHVNWKTRDDDLDFLREQVEKLPGTKLASMFANQAQSHHLVGDTNATTQDAWYGRFFRGGCLDMVKGNNILDYEF
jgi:hypothetical protein